ncbi:DUF5643 domain-containing protein [Cohnella cholangitidis]|uniref:DUF5643 domain-containing protein n=1 Tax=Cohnella cholangitidis TaxID=2598458 RepID=A0A7G5BSR2_9BACL|nr:DUF5643 domain-containing protein [Cohnella cholangitidis]QMV39996.1 hypothetical protein FPL14_01330 [Cohnella cholangitidis]
MRRFHLVATIIRRGIIVIFAILLVPRAIAFVPDSRGDKENIKALKQDGPVTKYEVHQTMAIDQDRFTVNELYWTPKQTVIRYTYRTQDAGGWSLPQIAFKLYGPQGEEYKFDSSSSSGSPWGSTGFIYYASSKEPPTSLNLVYEWYDRRAELNLPLQKGGEKI